MADEQNNQRANAQPVQTHKVPPPDDGLDTIPVNKTPVGLIVGILAAVLVVSGTLVWSMGGSKAKKADTNHNAAASEEGLSKEELKERREHIAMTQRALAKAAAAEEEEKAKQEAAKAAKDAEAKTAEKSKGGGRAPVSGAAAKKTGEDLDSALDSTLSGLQ